MAVAPAPSETLIHLTTAPAYYGSNIAWLLLGFIATQAYQYYTHGYRDPFILRLCVYGSIFLTVTQTAIETYCGTYYFVQFWGHANAITTPPRPLVFQTLFDGIVGFLVQVFFLWRIWVFVGRSLVGRALCIFTTLTSLLALACSLAIPIIFVQVDNLALLKAKTGNLNLIWLSATSAADAFIAVSMTAILSDARSRSHYSETRDILSKLTRITIQTGTLTFCIALTVLIIRVNVHVGTLHTLGTYLLGKSYVLSLLLNLNTRSIRNRTEKLTKLTFSQPSSRLHQSRTTQSTTLPFDAITENGTVPPGTGSTYELHDFEAKGKAEGGSIGGYSDIHLTIQDG